MGPTLQEVLAENIRKVRLAEGLRQDEVATRARSAGVTWTSVTVATIESGQRAVSSEELLLLPIVFDRPLADFLDTDSALVRVSETAAVLATTLRAVVLGEWDKRPTPTRRAIPYIGEALDERVVRALQTFGLQENLLTYFLVAEGRRGEAERKAAQSLKADTSDIAAASLAIYGRDLTTERDLRAAEATQEGQEPRAVRGHVTRNLLADLREALSNPTEVTPVAIDDDLAAERTGVVHQVLRKTDLTVNPSVAFEMLLKTYVALDDRFEEEGSVGSQEEHRITIRRTRRTP